MQNGVREPLIDAEAPAAPENGFLLVAASTSALAGDALAGDALAKQISRCIYWSLAANITLLLVKTTAFLISGSMAVLASAVDSLVDLFSQAVISLADRSMARRDVRYPAGKARLEPISVLACAFIMSLGALGVVQESAGRLAQGIRTGTPPPLDLTPPLVWVLGAALATKAALWWFCSALRALSGAAEALAEDHMNDVASIFASILTATLATSQPRLWWADPTGGILISLVIVWRWVLITCSSVSKVVGVAARPELLDLVRALAAEHHPATTAGYVRAYHAGQRVAVDVELEGPSDLTILDASGISQTLKEKLEALHEVETASVVVVPHSAHISPSQPALLPSVVSKPPAAADGAEAATPPAARAAEAAVPATRSSTGGELEQPATPAGGVQAQQPPPPLGIRRLSAPAGLHPADQPVERVAPPGASTAPAAHAVPAVHAASLAEHMAWMRSLRDQTGRGLKSCSFRQRDALRGVAAAAAVLESPAAASAVIVEAQQAEELEAGAHVDGAEAAGTSQ